MLAERFQELDAAVTDMNAKKAVLEDAQAATAAASDAYQASVSIAQELRTQIRAELDAAVPADATGVTVR